MNIEKNSYQRIIDNLNDGLYFVDTDRKITYWNQAAEKISGFKAEEVVGRHCSDNILTHVDKDGNHLCLSLCPLAATMQDDNPRSADVYLHHKNGHRVPVTVRVSTITDENGKVIGGAELFSDASNKEANKLRIAELEKMASVDKLTQLANRNFLDHELKSRFEEYKRIKTPFGLLFIDIDHFKKFNDTYGHDVGDKVLKFVSKTIFANCRPYDVYGRWGGEEFLGIIKSIDSTNLKALANRLRLLINNSYILVENQKLGVTISIGVTLISPDDDIESLIKRADTLLYKSKESGRNRITFG